MRLNLTLLSILALTGCSGATSNGSFTSEIASTLNGADRVEVFRVDPKPSADAGKNVIDGYPITATGKEQGREFAKKLSAILLSDSVIVSVKKCGLDPGVGYRFWKGKDGVDVVVCFNCDVLRVRKTGAESTDFNEGMRDFDPVRAKLLRLTKEAFPEDKEIQGLTEQRDH